MNKKIYLIPVGKASSTSIEKLIEPLKEKFGFAVEIGKGIDNIQFAYSKKRNQFHSSLILDELKKYFPKDAAQILGIADVDLYVPSLNFVFGEAYSDSSVAIISLIRLREEFYGMMPSRTVFEKRMIKEAVHELGHCFKLGHCQNPACVMHFSNSLHDTDIKSPNFCSSCEEKLKIMLNNYRSKPK
ncbi:MAG: archaemetzincin [Acidobacteriota bacterium]